MQLRVLSDRLAVCRLPSDAQWPTPPADRSFFAAVRTAEEISVVCVPDSAPSHPELHIEPDWRALEVVGPLDFAMVGVLLSITAPLSEVGVSVFVVSTFDTDYVLVRADSLEASVTALRAAGHEVAAA